jgi:hypothetical protein
MGISIAYRGTLADLSRVEDFEDRLLDLALDVGGLAQIWRSHSDSDPERIVRGVILDLLPGQESTSMLVSPEGWLVGLMDIENAEAGRLTEPPWCITKTQFGSIEGHVMLVELLTAVRREFVPDLEVSDEGGYWETRDVSELGRRFSLIQEAIDGLVEGLRRSGLTREAAEDPEILARRIERIASQVHRTLRRPAEHAPVEFPDDSDSGPGLSRDANASELAWDEAFKHNRRQQERLDRAIEDRLSQGEDAEEALAKALDDVVPEIPGEEPDCAGEPWHNDEDELHRASDETGADECDEHDALISAGSDERHPLLQRAMDLLHDLHAIFRDTDPRHGASLRTLFQGAGDVMGGLAQGLSTGEYDDEDDYGLRVTQLKRALRGAAFARGALFLLRTAMTAEQLEDLHGRLTSLREDTFHEMGRLRSEYEEGRW